MADSRHAYAAPVSARGPSPGAAAQFRLVAPGTGLAPSPSSPMPQPAYVGGPGYAQAGFGGFRYPQPVQPSNYVIVQPPQHHIPHQPHPHQQYQYVQRHQFPPAALQRLPPTPPPPAPPPAPTPSELSESAARCSGFFGALLRRSRTAGSSDEDDERWRRISGLVRGLISERIDAAYFVSQLKVALNSKQDSNQLMDFFCQHLPEYRRALRQGRVRLEGLAPLPPPPASRLPPPAPPLSPPATKPPPAPPLTPPPPQPRSAAASVFCPAALRLRLQDAARTRGLPDAAESAAALLAAAVERRLLDLLEGAAAAAEHRLEPASASASATAPGSLAVVAFTEGGRRGLRWRRHDRAFAAAAGDSAESPQAPPLRVGLADLARALASDRSREARKFLFKAAK
ncbi:hypothetical protein BOX15_Mlig020863g1 [Macrostomum lignano]|uniref:TAFH domain-containing protein n=1 Tax=Macrostomum lignano TaxID=282301 RepID=A0A267GWS6_9PLAT|nr:hypothetical protein BOX15_Mlig020863g1 [Macrostomum lignano]